MRSLVFVAGIVIASTSFPAGTAPPPAGIEALASIVGTWQSDVAQGRSARSTCVWTPAHTAVICDQTITAPDGTQHATDLLTFDPAAGKYVFYLLNHPGDPMRPVALSIDGKVWTYGGTAPDDHGVWYRTLNDFSELPKAYTWSRQSSADGRTWKTIAGGRSTRVADQR